LSCNTETNIVLYSNKNNIKSTPSVVMYFCKSGTPTISQNIRTITMKNNTILIEALDSTWIDFVNNIGINK
jgi:hypothetical protein